MIITLPPKINSTEQVPINTKSIVVIGANGAGKTRFGSAIEAKYNNITHRISAQKSLSMPEQVNTTSKINAENDFRYGYSTGGIENKLGQRWGNKPNTFLLNDYQKLMVLLHTEEYEESIKFKDAYNPGQVDAKPVTKLDRIQGIWEEVLPHRKIIKSAGKIETYPTENPDKIYNAAEMSDGERVIFYLIGEVISVTENSILVIDEPEMHLHKSITKILWDRIEQERPDCTFIYLTHDIDFASSRQNSTKIWAKGFDGTSWDYEILDDNLELPEHLYFEILGSRKPILFTEGDDSSIDYKLFQLVFSEYTVKPLGNCTKVFETAKSFNEQKSFHNIASFGLIDRDRRTEEEINHITHNSIWVSEVAEVENFLLLEDVVKAVASSMNKNTDEVFEAVKNNVIDFFKTEVEHQAVQHTAAHIEHLFNDATDFTDVKEFTKLEYNLNYFWKNQNFRGIYTGIKTNFERLIATKNYDVILKVFNNKGLLVNSKVAALCDLNPKKNTYLNRILLILKEKSDCSNKIRKAIIDNIRKNPT
ncbi:MAG: DUF4435 domain-containing protein [Bellilinea sp.]